MKNKLFIISLILFIGAFFLLAPKLHAQTKKRAVKEEDILRWASVPFSTGYILQIKNKNDEIVVNNKTKKTSYNIQRLKEGGIYFYRITVLNRLGVREATSKWIRFQLTKISIPTITSMDKNTFPAKQAGTINAKGKLFDKKNTLFITEIEKVEKDPKKKKKQKKGSTNLRTEVKSPTSMKILLPGNLSKGEYEFSFRHHERGDIYQTKTLLHIGDPLKRIAYRFRALPTFYIPLQTPYNKLFTLGFGLDLHFGIREAKQFEIGVSLGAYGIGARRDMVVSDITYLPVAIYFGYGFQIKKQFEIFPYLDIGLDSFFLHARNGFEERIEESYFFSPRMNVGILFGIRKGKVVITLGSAVNMTYNKKFLVGGLLLNAGVGVEF